MRRWRNEVAGLFLFTLPFLSVSVDAQTDPPNEFPIILNEPVIVVKAGGLIPFQVSTGRAGLGTGMRLMGRVSESEDEFHVCVVKVYFPDGPQTASDGECLARGVMEAGGGVSTVNEGVLIDQAQRFFLYDVPSSWRDGPNGG